MSIVTQGIVFHGICVRPIVQHDIIGVPGGGGGVPPLPPNISTPLTWLFTDGNDVIKLDGDLTTERATTATYVEAGEVLTAEPNQVRYEVADGRTMALIEGESTNLIKGSTDLSAPGWSTFDNAHLTHGRDGTLAPDGMEAQWFNKTTANSTELRRSDYVAVSAGDVATFSVWLKKRNSESITLSIYQQAPSNAYISNITATLTDEWQRFEVTGTCPNDGSIRLLIFNWNYSDDAYVWGPQTEKLPFASSYIPTPTTFVSRASTGTYYDENGVMQEAAIDEARYTYDPSDLSKPPYLLVEGASRNKRKYSDLQDGFSYIGGNSPHLSYIRTSIPEYSTSGLACTMLRTVNYFADDYDIKVGGTLPEGVYIFSYFMKDITGVTPQELEAYAEPNNAGFTKLAGGMEDYGSGVYRYWRVMQATGPQSGLTFRYGRRISGGSLEVGTTATIFNVSLGEWRNQLTSFIPNPTTFQSRASEGTYFDSKGFVKTAAVDEARYTFDPENLTKPPYLLVEGEATNLFVDSVQMNTNVFSNTGEILLNQGIAPDGTNTLLRFTGNGVSDGVWQVISFNPNSTYILTFWASSDVDGAFIKVRGETGNFESFIYLDSELKRYTHVINTGDTPSTSAIFYVDNTVCLESVYIWGAQIEEGAQATSYIPTNGTVEFRAADSVKSTVNTRSADVTTSEPVTRAADNISFEGAGNHPDVATGIPLSMFLRFNSWFTSDGNLSDGTDVSYARLRLSRGNLKYYRSGLHLDIIENYTAGSTKTAAFTVNASDTLIGYEDGVKTNEGIHTPEVPGAPTSVVLGDASVYGHISDFMVFNEALTAGQIERLHDWVTPFPEYPSHLPQPLTHLLSNGTDVVSLSGGLTTTRSTEATYVEYGEVKTAPANTLRYERVDGRLMALVEGESTNICLESSPISIGDNWKGVGVDIVQGQLAPDGSSDAVAFNQAADAAMTQFFGAKSTGTSLTFSVWLKKHLSDTCEIGMFGVTPFASKVVTLTDEWVKHTISTTLTADATDAYIAIGKWQQGMSAYIWGAQVEELAFATSYIPTTGSPATRAADLISFPVNGNVPAPNTSETWFIKFKVYKRNTDNTLSTFLTGMQGAASRFMKGDWGTTGAAIKNGTASVRVLSGHDESIPHTIGMTKSGTYTIAYGDGASGGTQISTTVDEGDIVAIGTAWNGTSPIYGHISDFMVFDEAFVAEQMADLHEYAGGTPPLATKATHIMEPVIWNNDVNYGASPLNGDLDKDGPLGDDISYLVADTDLWALRLVYVGAEKPYAYVKVVLDSGAVLILENEVGENYYHNTSKDEVQIFNDWVTANEGKLTPLAIIGVKDIGTIQTTNLVENGSFTENMDAWTSTRASMESIDGKAHVTSEDGRTRHYSLSQDVSVEAGKSYSITFTIDEASELGSAKVVLRDGNQVLQRYEAGTWTYTYEANDSNLALNFKLRGNHASLMILDDIEVKED